MSQQPISSRTLNRMRSLKEFGYTHKAIARECGVSIATVSYNLRAKLPTTEDSRTTRMMRRAAAKLIRDGYSRDHVRSVFGEYTP